MHKGQYFFTFSLVAVTLANTSGCAVPRSADPAARSVDAPGDIRLMWETSKLNGNAGPRVGPNPRASTDRAIDAASRVFNTVRFVGKTRAEVVQLLGDPQTSNDSVYNFPFYPASPDALVYRFDCGSYGWQFNVLFDEARKVSSVERHWIR